MKKTIGYSMVAVQFFAQISPAFAGVFQADEQSVAQTRWRPDVYCRAATVVMLPASC